MRRILVLRGGALGDFIVTLPTLAALRRRWPEARVEIAGNPTAAALALRRGIVHAVYSQHEARWAALYGEGELPADFRQWLSGFDLVLNYWPDPDGTLRRRFPTIPRQHFASAAAVPTIAPAAAHYAAPLSAFGISCDQHICRITPVAPESSTSAEFRDTSFVALHPGSGSPRKNWPVERWIEVIASVSVPVALLIGDAERDRWTASQLRTTALRARIESGTVRVVEGRPLEHLVTLLSAAHVFVGHDSGISHLAAACGTPALLLFGPTNPSMWAPPSPNVKILRKSADLDSITVGDVTEALRPLVEASFRRR